LSRPHGPEAPRLMYWYGNGMGGWGYTLVPVSLPGRFWPKRQAALPTAQRR